MLLSMSCINILTNYFCVFLASLLLMSNALSAAPDAGRGALCNLITSQQKCSV